MDWKDKRIEAINRLSKLKKWSFSDNNPLFKEVMDIYDSPATTRKEYMKERRSRFDKISVFGTIRNKLRV